MSVKHGIASYGAPPGFGLTAPSDPKQYQEPSLLLRWTRSRRRTLGYSICLRKVQIQRTDRQQRAIARLRNVISLRPPTAARNRMGADRPLSLTQQDHSTVRWKFIKEDLTPESVIRLIPYPQFGPLEPQSTNCGRTRFLTELQPSSRTSMCSLDVGSKTRTRRLRSTL